MNGADSVVIVDMGTQTQTLNEGMHPEPHAAFGGAVVVEDASVKKLPEDWPENAEMQPDGSVIVTLGWPVRFKLREADGTIRDGDTYETLHLHRLKGKHKLAMGAAVRKGGVEFERTLIMQMAGLDAGRVERLHNEMDQADLAVLVYIANFFTTAGRRIGPVF